MAFKEGTEVDHVHSFRALVSLGTSLSEKIDINQLTPHEALAELKKAVAVFPPEPKKVKDA